jgi:acyl-CoA synthetase (AMP-forming)/AMP-acid ligase II
MIINPAVATPQTLFELGKLRSDENPNGLAITFLPDGEDKSENITYGELDIKAKKIASVLQSMKAVNKPVLLMFEPGIDFVCAFFGCQYAGAIAVPVQTPSNAESWNKQKDIFDDARAALILSTSNLTKKVIGLAEGTRQTHPIRWVIIDDLSFDGEYNWTPPVYGKEHTSFLQYTSGSTGAPKGVMVSHANILHNSYQISQNFKTTKESKCVSWLPHFHDMGLIGGIIQPLFVGCPLILMSPFHFVQRPIRWLKAMAKHNATTTGGPCFSFDLCVKIAEQDCHGLDLSSWKVAFCGGEPVRKQTLDNFADKFSPYGFNPDALLPCYGLAESTLFVTGCQPGEKQRSLEIDLSLLSSNILKKKLPHDDFPSLRIISSGKPQEGTELKIVNPETLSPCMPEIIGEIWVASDSVSKGYWNKPKISKETFEYHYTNGTAKTGFLRTGDTGFLNDGELYITGRIKDMLIINGKNLFPQDIEQTTGNAHSQIIVNGTAAFSRVNQTQKEELILVCELKRNTNAEEFDVIRKSIRQKVFFQFGISPSDIVFIPQRALPRTSSGKIKRYLCKQHYLSAQLKLFQK